MGWDPGTRKRELLFFGNFEFFGIIGEKAKKEQNWFFSARVDHVLVIEFQRQRVQSLEYPSWLDSS